MSRIGVRKTLFVSVLLAGIPAAANADYWANINYGDVYGNITLKNFSADADTTIGTHNTGALILNEYVGTVDQYGPLARIDVSQSGHDDGNFGIHMNSNVEDSDASAEQKIDVDKLRINNSMHQNVTTNIAIGGHSGPYYKLNVNKGDVHGNIYADDFSLGARSSVTANNIGAAIVSSTTSAHTLGQ